MEAMVYGILWDMDGVLVDTGELHWVTWSKALKEFDLQIEREFFERTFGMNNFGVIEALLGQNPEAGLVQGISDRKEALFREQARQVTRVLPGVQDCLERLSRVPGYRQAVASSAPVENIDLLVDAFGLRRYFTALVSAFALPSKPDPAVFLEAARQVGAPPERCVVVEDSLAGVEAAKAAGMKCLAVTNSQPAENLAAADLIVDSLEKVPVETFARLLGH